VQIINSGNGYVEDPLIRISHPQTRKKADYFYNEIYHEDYKVIPFNILVSSDKSFYVMGSRVDISDETGDTQLADKGYFAKYNSDGVLLYGKVLASTLPYSNSSDLQNGACGSCSKSK